MARKRQHTAGQPLEDILNGLLQELGRQSIHEPGDHFGRWEGSLNHFVGERLHLKLHADRKRYMSASTYVQPLHGLRAVTVVRRVVSGSAARGKAGEQPAVYQIDLQRTITRADLQRYYKTRNEEQRIRHKRERHEEHLAGEYGTETTGGPVTVRQMEPEPTPELAKVEYRHHTHFKPEPPAKLHEDITNGRQSIRPRLDGEQHHRALLDILAERDAELARLTGRLERAEAKTAELQELLDQLTDPSITEADAYIKAEQARKAKR